MKKITKRLAPVTIRVTGRWTCTEISFDTSGCDWRVARTYVFQARRRYSIITLKRDKGFIRK